MEEEQRRCCPGKACLPAMLPTVLCIRCGKSSLMRCMSKPMLLGADEKINPALNTAAYVRAHPATSGASERATPAARRQATSTSHCTAALAPDQEPLAMLPSRLCRPSST